MAKKVRQYVLGEQVVGKIETLLSYGIFVQLEDGTRAYFRRRELSWAGNDDPRDQWQIGQQIRGQIIKLPLDSEQHIELSHKTLLADPWHKIAGTMQPGDIVTGTVKSLMSYGVYVEVTPGVDGFIPLAELSSQDVQQPETVLWLGDKIEAVVMRINIDAKKLKLSIRLRLQQLETVANVMKRLGFTSEIDSDIEPLPHAEKLTVDLCNPYENGRLDDAKMGGDQRPVQRGQDQANRSDVVPASFYKIADNLQSSKDLHRKFFESLRQLVSDTGAEAGIVFLLDTMSQDISIAARSSSASFHEEAIHSLIASPVKDVIVDNEPILEKEMVGSTKDRFRKLLDLITFNSCIGIPIQTATETQYALFLLHDGVAAFHRFHLRDALATAALMAAAIERDLMQTQIQKMNQHLLSGQLAAGFGHEVYNKMSGLEIQLRLLQNNHAKLGHQLDKNQATEELIAIQSSIDSLSTVFQNLKDVVALFQGLMQTDEMQVINLNTVLSTTVALIIPVFRDKKIKLLFEPNQDLPEVTSIALRLQQAFLNILLNASQHLPADGIRKLSIETSYDPTDQVRPIKIRFIDTGCGIHKQLWEKAFDLGFTTRADGTGQGLYLARSLIESLGGRVWIEKSVMLMGTTFIVECPVDAQLY